MMSMLFSALLSFAGGYVGVIFRSTVVEKKLKGEIVELKNTVLEARLQINTVSNGVDNLNQKLRKQNWEIFPPVSKDDLDKN